MSGWRFNNSRIGTKDFETIDPWTGVKDGGVWNLDRFYNTDAQVPIPFSNGDLPLSSSSELQWGFDAGVASNFSANTYQSLTSPFGGASVLGTTDWISQSAITRSSYTTYGGSTQHYFTINQTTGSSATNITLNTNSFNGTAINDADGFTIFGVAGPNSNGNFIRPFNYFGMGTSTPDVNSAAGVPAWNSSRQFSNALIFFGSGGAIQLRRPSPSTANGNFAYVGGSSTALSGYGTSSNQIISFVFRQLESATTTTSAYYWVRNRNNSTGVLTQTYNGTAFSFNGTTPGYGVKNSVDTARPSLGDDIYFQSGSGHRWHCLGFANRPYTTQECLDLVDYLDDRYVNN
tara:strand:- start:354 stop:1391 length:1038 start_codon:yes stop_codon:yes gene_type:complete